MITGSSRLLCIIQSWGIPILKRKYRQLFVARLGTFCKGSATK